MSRPPCAPPDDPPPPVVLLDPGALAADARPGRTEAGTQPARAHGAAPAGAPA